MSKAGMLPQRYFFIPNCCPNPSAINEGVRFSRTQAGCHVALLRRDLQSDLCCVQCDFWHTGPQYYKVRSVRTNIYKIELHGHGITHKDEITVLAGVPAFFLALCVCEVPVGADKLWGRHFTSMLIKLDEKYHHETVA
jgi:hypothetical protein